MEESKQKPLGTDSTSDHLCVLVHGLWGNPGHLIYLERSLRKLYAEDQLHIRVPKTNSGNYTYDGIEVGGERITQEIEEYLEDFEKSGVSIKKLSVVGYSLGGLIARYAIGLLDSRGWFAEGKLQPVNFTAFASPFLGVRNPYIGPQYRLWNVLGSTTLSVSGQQLFLTDHFRDTGRPLLAVLADPQSIFMKALAKFKNRVLYCNIINDRSAPYYTTAISLTDPFTDLDALELNYMPGRAPNLLDPAEPVSFKTSGNEKTPLLTRLTDSTSNAIKAVPYVGLLTVLIPISLVGFLVNSGIQSFRSQQRIRFHDGASYRIPLLTDRVRDKVAGALEDINPRPRPHRSATGTSVTQTRSAIQETSLPKVSNPSSSASSTAHTSSTPPSSITSDFNPNHKGDDSDGQGDCYDGTLKQTSSLLPPTSVSTQPLALTSDQIKMITALDDLGFRKFRVHITKVRHSHAAIIYRSTWRKGLREGEVVVGHWLSTQFEL